MTEVKKKVGCKIFYLEFLITGIISLTKTVALECEEQVEVNETWDFTKLLVHGTATHIDVDTIVGKFIFGWETWSFSSLYLLLSLSFSFLTVKRE